MCEARRKKKKPLGIKSKGWREGEEGKEGRKVGGNETQAERAKLSEN